ncbi:MAG: WD40 repeat domain-containing protein [Gemmataceae bacterium]
MGSDAKAAILWDARTGKQLRRLVGHRKKPDLAAVCSLALSPDGKILATAGEDRTIRFWNWKTGEQLRQFTSDSSERTMCFTFSPDGKTLVWGASSDSILRLGDVDSGKLRHKLKQIDSPRAAAFSPDGKTLAVGTYDQTIRLWDTSSGRHPHPRGHDGEILSLAFLPEGKHIATVGCDGTLRVWETKSGEELRRVSIGATPIFGTSLSANGERLATRHTGEKDFLCLWDVSAGIERRRLTNIPKAGWAFALSPDGRTLMASDWDEETGSRLFLWDLTHPASAKPLIRKFLCETEDEKRSSIGGIVFSADSKTAAVGVEDENIWLIDLAAFKAAAKDAKERAFAQSLPLYGFWSSLALSVDASMLAVGQYDLFGFISRDSQSPSLRVCNTSRPFHERGFGQLKKDKGVDAVAFSPDGKMLAAARRDGTILLWETATAKVRRSLSGHQGPVHQLLFSRDGSLLASGGADTTVLIWDVWKP